MEISLLFTLTKKEFNIVIMVFCVDCVDTKYKFTFVNIKDTGRQSDGSVYINNDMGYRFENDLLNVLQPTKLSYSEKIFPYVSIKDDAFGLKNHFMKSPSYPFQNLSLADRVFSYRSSQWRRVIENGFVVGVSRFHVPVNQIIVKPTTFTSIN